MNNWCSSVCVDGHSTVWQWAVAILIIPAIVVTCTFVGVMRIKWLKKRGKW